MSRNAPNPVVQCMIYLRHPGSKPGTFTYTSVQQNKGTFTQGYLMTVHPPLVGDTFMVLHPKGDRRIEVCVLKRRWIHSEVGSTNWPHHEPYQTSPVLLDLLVEETTEMFFKDEE